MRRLSFYRLLPFIIVALVAVTAALVVHFSLPSIPVDEGGWLYNGSFESIGDSRLPDGWQNNSEGRGTVVRITRDAFRGKKSVYMSSKAGSRATFASLPVWNLTVTKGVASFKYKAVASSLAGANLTFAVVPITAERKEGGGKRTVFTVPPEHINDDSWHTGSVAFDYTECPAVERIAVSFDINSANEQGTGEWIIDDATIEPDKAWLDPQITIVGAAPSEGILLASSGRAEGTCTIINSGQKEARDVEVTVEISTFSDGHKVATVREERSIPSIAEGSTASIKWIGPPLQKGWLRVKATAGNDSYSSWTPVRTNVAKTPEAHSLTIGDTTRRLILDQEQPALLRFFVRDREWKEVARAPWLVRVQTDDHSAEVWTPANATIRDNTITITEFRKAGSLKPVDWKAEMTLFFDDRNGEFVVSLDARPHQKTNLRLLQLPTVLVGEGSTGGEKNSAIFPGVEFLGPNERSSGVRALLPPESNRWSPHPYMVTIPLMAVQTDDATVALRWDPLANWYKGNNCPTPLFASPNFLDGQQNHKLSIFVPAIPQYVAKNGVQASRPIAIDGSIRIKAAILMEPNRTPLSIVKDWATRFPDWKDTTPPRNRASEAELVAKALTETIWNKDAEAWERVKTWKPEANAEILVTSLRLARKIDNRKLRARLIDRVQRVIRRHGRDLTDLDAAFAVGGLPEAVGALKEQAYEAISRQNANGGWTFQPDKEHENLGKRGDTEVGISATELIPILRYAEVTRDKKAIQSVRIALAYMDRFSIPAGAQMWECPLYAPDMLAASKAIDAYLAGYRITGNKRYLEKAVYWASTGLPFIYLWAAPDRPIMQGASIPIFGGTQFTRSWIGVAVQWNGLDYASSLYDLAEYDSSFDWAALARTITCSAMRQQALEGNNLGLYPDVWSLISNRSGDPWLNPAIISKNLWKAKGDKWVTTRRMAELSLTLPESAEVRRSANRITIAFTRKPLLESDCLLLSGVNHVPQIRVNNNTLKRVKDLSAVKSGVAFDAKERLLYAKVQHSGAAKLVIELAGEPDANR